MSTARDLLTNFSKGELSPLIEGRSDLAAYFEGGRTVENWNVMRQGGATRRPGTLAINLIKDSSKDTILFPFETSVSDAYVVEVGAGYMRFFKDRAQIASGGVPVEVVTPYTTALLRDIHFVQSVDVMYLFNGAFPQGKLSRVSAISFAYNAVEFNPPPSFEDDNYDPSGTGNAGTLTPGATTGNGVTFTASGAGTPFYPADVGRIIVFGASQAIIRTTGASPQLTCTADITVAFPNTNPIPQGQWALRLSPQCTLDPDLKAPIGTQVTLVAGAQAFRTNDVGKYINIYGGVVKITVRDSVTQVRGTLLSEMGNTDAANPNAAPAGAWTLEVPSWSVANGYAYTGCLFQGRLVQGGSDAQKTTFWLSSSDDYENYAIGVAADSALEYQMASKGFNPIRWMEDVGDLMIGTLGAEHRATSGKTDEPFGGDKVPLVTKPTDVGGALIQPIVYEKKLLMIDRSLKKMFILGFDYARNDWAGPELTPPAEHIFGSGVKLGPMAFAKRPDPRVYIVREDGQMVTLTYLPDEKVIGFTRYVTNGKFEAVAVTPQSNGNPDKVWVIVNRTINGETKRFVEVFSTEVDELADRAWSSLQTDCAKVYDLGGTEQSTFTGLNYLEGCYVDVIADGSYIGQYHVVEGAITIDNPASEHVEVGLHYESTLETMRPAIQGRVTEGLPREWKTLWVRLHNSLGGKLNDQDLIYPTPNLDQISLFTGDLNVTGYPSDGPTEGRVKIVQNEPYPITVLAVFGEIEFGDQS